ISNINENVLIIMQDYALSKNNLKLKSIAASHGFDLISHPFFLTKLLEYCDHSIRIIMPDSQESIDNLNVGMYLYQQICLFLAEHTSKNILDSSLYIHIYFLLIHYI